MLLSCGVVFIINAGAQPPEAFLEVRLDQRLDVLLNARHAEVELKQTCVRVRALRALLDLYCLCSCATRSPHTYPSTHGVMGKAQAFEELS